MAATFYCIVNASVNQTKMDGIYEHLQLCFISHIDFACEIHTECTSPLSINVEMSNLTFCWRLESVLIPAKACKKGPKVDVVKLYVGI